MTIKLFCFQNQERCTKYAIINSVNRLDFKMRQIIGEEPDTDGYVETDFASEREAWRKSKQVRDRIEYWHELRRLRQLLDDPNFSDF